MFAVAILLFSLAFQIIESTDLVPIDGDVAKITRRAEEFRDLPEAIQRNLQTFLTLTMDALATIHHKVKTSMAAEATRQMASVVSVVIRKYRC